MRMSPEERRVSYGYQALTHALREWNLFNPGCGSLVEVKRLALQIFLVRGFT